LLLLYKTPLSSSR